MERAHDEVDFYLRKLLTVHGYFRHYLWRIKKIRCPQCRYCGAERDDASHTFFNCVRFSLQCSKLASADGGDISPNNSVGVMLRSEKLWDAVAAFAETVLRNKKDDGCLQDP